MSLAISPALDAVFLAVQGFIVAFLLLHDWIPLGRLNNLAAIRTEDSLSRRVVVTLLGGIPAALGLFGSVHYYGQRYPHWLKMYFWITYGLLVAGFLRAWYIPYLLWPDPTRAARYQTIFAGTHSFLPRRNGIAPNTLHIMLHAAIVTTVCILFVR